MVWGRRGTSIQLVVLLWSVSVSFGFNLEPRTGLIYNYPYADTQGREAYFGFSVALQHVEDSNTNWIIVGAPRANLSYFDNDEIQEPGAVFRCSLTSNTCEEQRVDPTGNKYGRDHYAYVDLKNHGWLGGSLDSQPSYQSDRQATCVCAPLWKDQRQINKNKIYMNGACYIAYGAVYNATTFDKKVPLVRRGYQIVSGFKKYAYGQAGFSVHFPDDPTKLIIGTPGVYEWKGSVMLFKDVTDGTNIEARKKRDVSHDDMFAFYDNVPSVENSEESDLLGYSITSGKFLHQDKTHYAAGAPRGANSFGKVIIFEFPSNEESRLWIKEEFTGDQLGEYFGAALTAADIDGDGLDDLVIGSPLHSFYDLDIPDVGRVQTFPSKQGIGRHVRPKLHYGNKVSFARFGTSLASPGDLNADNYEDIVVGAPWEGNGAVYIFLGSPSGLKDQYSQRLSPEDFTPGLKGFGMSISRGIDVDDNGYSDLAIGIFRSGHALVVKSRPVATLSGEVIPSPSSVAWEEETVVTIRTCLHYKGYRNPPNLSVQAKLILDPGNITIRAVFPNNSNIYSFVENLVIDKDTCRNHKMTVKKDKVNPDYPISMRLEYELMDDSDTELIKKPVTDPTADNYTVGYVGIVKDCNETICKVNMKTKATFINGTIDSVVIGKTNMLHVEVSNSGEPVYLPTMTVTADPSLILTLPMSHDCIFLTDDMKTSLKCHLSNPIRSNNSTDTVDVGVRVDENLLRDNTSHVKLEIYVTGEGKELSPDDNIINRTLKLTTQANLTLLGSSEEEQVHYKLTDDKKKIILTENPRFNHTYIVVNKGPTPLRFVNLTLSIPVSFTDGLEFVKVYGWKPSTCHLNGTQLASDSSRSRNSANGPPAITTNNDHSSSEIQSVSAEKEEDVGVQYFNCSSSLIRCAQLYCHIPDWTYNSQSTKVLVELAIDLNILAKHISVKGGAVISTNATVTIQSFYPQSTLIGKTITTEEVVTYIQPDRLLSNGVPWWVILLAVLGSLLLLGLVTYGLYKKGFFKREKMEEVRAHRENLGATNNAVTDD